MSTLILIMLLHKSLCFGIFAGMCDWVYEHLHIHGHQTWHRHRY